MKFKKFNFQAWKVKGNLTYIWQISYCRCQSKDKVRYKDKQFKSANASLGLLNRVRTS